MKLFIRVTLRAAILAVSGCVATKVSPNAVTLNLDYTWMRCSLDSPVIHLTEVPVKTKKLRVSVTDLDEGDGHGGGTVPYTGADTIAAGALSHLRGPCPPGVQRYSMRMDAVDASGVIIGRGEKTKPCC